MKIVVIGAGAAGFFAAINAAEQGAEVILVEKSQKVLAKVRVSGGGRCNVTNGVTDFKQLSNFYPRGNKELRGPFTIFNNIDTQKWFTERGVKLKTEPDGRVFPVSNSSQTIIDCLMNESDRLKIDLRLGVSVDAIEKEDNLFNIKFGSHKLISDKIIVAAGGNPNLSFYNFLQRVGHTVIEPMPSLFTFNIPESNFSDLMGVAVQDAVVKIQSSKFQEEGPLLFTHWGISGPAVLRLSAWAARYLNELNYNFKVLINFVPAKNENELREYLSDAMIEFKNRKITSSKMFDLPGRLWERLCFNAGINENKLWGECSKVLLNKLTAALSSTQLNVSGKTTFKDEFVTCGGVSLKDVNMKTMESKIMPGLYFAGEVLDIDGITGGFNFQAAWTTGFIAGQSAAK